MKTISELLQERLPTEVAARAIANTPEYLRDVPQLFPLNTVLEEAFAWDKTPEPTSYWISVNEWMKKHMRGWYVDSEARYFTFEHEAVECCYDAGYKSIEQAYEAEDIYYYEQ
jgi:hypothetical protein